MQEKIIILDFGSQYTQLIARRVRELNIYCEILPYHSKIFKDDSVKGIILSGSPASVHDTDHPEIVLTNYFNNYPILAICYGAQLISQKTKGEVIKSNTREYGRAHLEIKKDDIIFANTSSRQEVWMSHGDSIKSLSSDFEIVASTEMVPVAAFRSVTGNFDKPIYGLQFHPEVTHSAEGKKIIENFCLSICNCKQDWTPESYIEETVNQIKNKVGNDKVVMALSGGVDSSVAAILVDRAIGKNLYCIFVDNGLLRKDEYQQVLDSYHHMGLNIKGVDAKDEFYSALKNISDPELKRKAIGKLFIDIFQREAKEIDGVKWLGQGTIYPDVIESVSVHGPSVTIKSHHNVGGLPEKMHLKIIEPLRLLFKDEVRRVGNVLKLEQNILNRHPFPGPGLAIRIIGNITAEKVSLLQEVDNIFINLLKTEGLYNHVWQAGAILTPIKTVGVMGDERTYEYVVALRAVQSFDGMTADWCHLPYPFLATVSNTIINKVKGVNRVVYDISSKPPATIEWE